MKIIIIGQCTLHWGRMEFGNIGNYYIIEPFIRELYANFPDSSIYTTLQMSDRFCKDENISVLPMEMYYGWKESDLSNALKELASVTIFSKTGFLPTTTPYIDEINSADLVIDFSGDIWGDNANFLGEDRFLVGLIKNRVAQLLGKKTVMIAGSPGPFNEQSTLAFAKEVFENFDLVTNRESISIDLLKLDGFNVSRVKSLACPAFLFEPKSLNEMSSILDEVRLLNKKKPTIGFILCGWNFIEGPFDKWPREDNEYIIFAECVEYITEVLGLRVALLSHSNGFPIPPKSFELIHGRDYLVTKQLESVITKRGISRDFYVIESVLDTWETKAVVSQFDMLVSGRIHGAVAGLSQLVPTVIIDYGHQPKAHKLKGFAIEAGVEDLVSDPTIKNDIISKIDKCWNNIDAFQLKLEKQIPIVKAKAKQNFIVLKDLFL